MAFEKVATIDEINPAKYVSCLGKELALFSVKGKIYCISNTCTHIGGPLAEGHLEGNIVTCPWHSAQFDVITGKALRPPAQSDVKSYTVKVEDNDVYVNID